MKPIILLQDKVLVLLITITISFFSSSILAETIQVAKLASQPTVDGAIDDWNNVPTVNIPLTNNKADGKAKISSVNVKAGIHGDSVYYLFEWDDSSMDDQHKPFVWDSKKNKYVGGKQREDRFAIQFKMSGEYDVNWLSGKLFTTDTWHWKAARSDGLGIAQDKMTVIGSEKVKKAYKGTTADGSTIYIQRPSDKGTKLYSTKRYSSKEKDLMPKYILASSASGSIADVKAKGAWSNGKWVLEMSRKLNTGNPDDVVFNVGQSVVGGIAIFDQSGDDDHSHSEIITFQY